MSNNIIKENLENELLSFNDNFGNKDCNIIVFKGKIYRVNEEPTEGDKSTIEAITNEILKYFPKLAFRIKGNPDFNETLMFIENLPYVIVGNYQDGVLYIHDNEFYDINQSGDLKKLINSKQFDKIFYNNKVVYDKSSNKLKMPSIDKLYHGTIVRYALDIVNYGLRPKPNNSTFDSISHNDTVFLATSYNEASQYATRVYMKSIDKNDILNQPVILIFNVSSMNQNKFIFDYDFHNSYTKQSDEIYRKIANNFLRTPQVVTKDSESPFKFGKVGYRGIVMPSSIEKIELPMQRKKFNNKNELFTFVNSKTNEKNEIYQEEKNINGKKIIYINESTINRLLFENRESKNINLARKLAIQKTNNVTLAQQIIDEIRTSIPNSRLAQCKFLLGVTRMYLDNELKDFSSISNLNQILKLIASEAHVDEYDNNLNNLKINELIQRFKANIENDIENDRNNLSKNQYQVNKNYEIKLIPTFEEAEKYGKYTSWCVTHDENMYNTYTSNGVKPFYFCLKNGFENAERKVGENCPLDEYGLSMIAISVNENGSLNTCTVRWNHDNGGNDSIMDTTQISQVLGVNFYEVFKPYSKEDIESKKLSYKQKYINALNEVNNGKDIYKVFKYVDELTDSLYYVGINENSDDFAIVTYEESDGNLYFLEDDKNMPLLLKQSFKVKNEYLSIIELYSNKSEVINFPKLYKVCDLPNDTYIMPLSDTLTLSGYFNNLFLLYDVSENRSGIRFFDLRNYRLSDSFFFSRMNPTTDSKLISITKTFENDKKIYFNTETFQFEDNIDDRNILPIIKTFSNKNGITYFIVENKEMYKNILDKLDGEPLFNEWFYNLSVYSTFEIIEAEIENNKKMFYDYSSYNEIKPLFNEYIIYFDMSNYGTALLGFESGKYIFYDMFKKEVMQVVHENTSLEQNVNDGKIIYISESVLDKLLLENRESKNINLARKFVAQEVGDQRYAQSIIDGIRTNMPNSRLAQCKFLLGLSRMYLNGELDDYATLSKLNQTLKLIASEAHVNEYDNNLNNATSHELIERFSSNINNDLENDKNEISKNQYQENTDYTIVKINSFEEAEKYSPYTDWCVTHYDNMYDTYTSHGSRPFYFCLKNGFENVEKKEGENCPFDEYGLSMIAISVNEDGSLNTCTVRWNHDNGGNDNIMDTKQISQIIGRNFYDVFKPYTQQEIAEKHSSLYNALIEKLNNVNNGSYLESEFAFSDSITDGIFAVGLNMETEETAIVSYNENDNMYHFLSDKNNNPLIYKHVKSVNDNLISVIDFFNGKSCLFDNTLTKVMDLPDNTYLTKIDNLMIANSGYFNDLFLLNTTFDANRYSGSSQFFDMKRKLMSEHMNSVKIYLTDNPNILYTNCYLYENSANKFKYFDIASFKFTNELQEGEQANLIEKVIKNLNGEKYYIAKNEKGLYNIYYSLGKEPIINEWVRHIDTFNNTNTVIIKYYNGKESLYTLIEGKLTPLFDEPISKVSNLGFGLVQIQFENGKVIQYSLTSNQIIKVMKEDNIIYINESTINKLINENLETEVTPNEINVSNVDKQDRLAPFIFNQSGKINPKIRLKLLDIADEFWFNLNLNWVNVKDIILTGSICNYNWNQYSDIDLHILIDYSEVDENKDLVTQFFTSIKNEWNDNHINLSMYGHTVELYVQDINEPFVANGIYSLEKNKWIKFPDKDEVKNIDGDADEIKNKAAMLMTIIDNMGKKLIISQNDEHKLSLLLQKINSFITRIKRMRKKGLESNESEMSINNLVYKLMRQEGYIDKLYKLKYETYDKINSLEK